MNLLELLDQRAEERPDAVAIADLASDRSLGFAALDAAVARRAATLRNAGLRPGDTLLVAEPASLDLYVTVLAALHQGMIAMIPDPAAGLEVVRDTCRRRPPAALVSSARGHAKSLLLPELRRIPRRFTSGARLPGVRSFRREGDARAEMVAVREDTPALLTFTSGSTGGPKAVLRTHGFLRAQHDAVAHALALAPGQVDLTTLPIFLLGNLAAGVTSVLPDANMTRPGALDAAPLVAAIASQGVTRTAASPALLERLAEHVLASGSTLDTLEQVFTGGAPVFPRVLAKLQEAAPRARVVAVYGSSEAEPIAHVDAARIEPADLDAMYAGRGLLAGEPVPEIRLRVVEDRWGRPYGKLEERGFDALACAQGLPGEIVVAGRHVLDGYLDGAGDAQTKIRVGDTVWHRTGDAGYLDERGRLWLLGRCRARLQDEHGTAWPFAIECAASRFPFVRRSALVAANGSGRVLAVEGEASAQDLHALEAALGWAQLGRVLAVPEIPVDARHNAKVDYTALAEVLPAR